MNSEHPGQGSSQNRDRRRLICPGLSGFGRQHCMGPWIVALSPRLNGLRTAGLRRFFRRCSERCVSLSASVPSGVRGGSFPELGQRFVCGYVGKISDHFNVHQCPLVQAVE